MKRWWMVMVLAGLFGLAGAALAKVNPYIEPTDSDWGGLDNAEPASWEATAAVGLFGRLAAVGDVDAFAYTFDEPRRDWRVEILVPVCDQHFVEFYPSVALIGPGLDAPEAGSLPFELSDGMGAQVLTTPYAEKRAASTSNFIGLDAYRGAVMTADIPEAGSYTLAVWEPEGHVGAYALSTGDQHDQFGKRPESEIRAAYRALETGSWLGADCDAPAVAATCPATDGQIGAAAEPEAPERAKVGAGFVLTGAVVDASTCQPIRDARITYWLVNEQGEYDADHRGTLSTNRQGLYRIESNRPGQYGPPPHIHLQIIAPGYQSLVTEYILQGDEDTADFPIALLPE
ncbi:MAG: hypothetical protein HZC41_12865 [Chloroflexi bacterium]|nr:hypothetical protein [Chloroflexota bacterium]